MKIYEFYLVFRILLQFVTSCNRIFSASYNDMMSYIALDRIMVCVPHNRILYRSDVNGSQKRKCEQGKQETRGLLSDKEANGGEAK